MELNRRSVLAGLCGIASAGVAGCLSRFRSSEAIPDNAIDITDHGGDPSGETSVLSALESAAEDGAALYFPSGEYLLDETWSFDGFEEFSIFGPEATIVVPEGFETHLFHLNSRDRPASLQVEGLSFDLSAPNTGGRLLDAQVTEQLVVRDLSVTGTAQRGPNLFRVDITDPGGTGLVERLSAPDGATADTTISGCYVGNRNRGDIRFVDCNLEGFPDNGLYADPPGGRMVVEGGYYANSGISNVRVRAGSLVENVHVRCDRSPEGFQNMRGIRLTNYAPDPEAPPAVVSGCTIEMIEVASSDGAIELSSDLNAAEIYDTQIRIDADTVHGLRAKSPSQSASNDTDTGFHCENVRITGSAANESAVYIVDRDECLFDNLCIHQTGTNRNGVELLRSNNNTVQNSYFNITGEPVLLRESTSEITALRTQPTETDGSLITSDCG